MGKKYAQNLYRLGFVILMLTSIGSINALYASHAQGADLTYTCLGGNQYRVRISFYRDCGGAPAPTAVNVSVSSQSRGQSLALTLSPISGTGQDVTPICPSNTTVCTGGNNPGVQEYIYEGTITLPMASTDWVFGFVFCCRNSVINTIQNPGGQNIYLQAYLNNIAAPGNSSPLFSNRPVPYTAIAQNYNFNHGAVDADGDSLIYRLITPATSPTTTVNYIAPFTASQPLASNPAMTFNSVTGDIAMTPSQLLVTVMAVRVEEWRNGVLIGSVVRDIQLQVISNANSLPQPGNINVTASRSIGVCVGQTLSFTINSTDPDTNQTVTMNWNNAIPNSSFVVSSGSRPTGTFTWTPTLADVSNAPHFFTVTVKDNNCPFVGSQTYAYGITVSGLSATSTAVAAQCGNLGSASVIATAGQWPYTYQWAPAIGSSATVSNLAVGSYSCTVIDAIGCQVSQEIIVAQGPATPVLAIANTPIVCYGSATGAASISILDGQAPFTYQWSTGDTGSSISNAVAGVYNVSVTSAGGCVAQATTTINQPALPFTATASILSTPLCNGDNTGSATVTISGGAIPFSYDWNIPASQNSATISGLRAGIYTATITDFNGCVTSTSVSISEPAPLSSAVVSNPVSCFSGNNGSAQVIPSGGSGTYTYHWNTNPVQTNSIANTLRAGTYRVNITDQNGCTHQDSAKITEPSILTSSISSVNHVSCYGGNDGSANIVAGGGTSPYSYSWSTTIPQTTATATNLPAGVFNATITDQKGCTQISAIIISQPSQILLSTLGDDTICPGQSVLMQANVSGGVGTYTYIWSSNLGNNSQHTVSPASSTNYTVQVMDQNGCMSALNTIAVDIIQFSTANLITPQVLNICEGSSTQLSASTIGNTGSLVWNWSNPSWNGAGPYTIQPQSTTVYTVTATNNCGSSATATTTVMVHPKPAVQLLPQQITGCDNAQLTIADVNLNTGAAYAWNFGDGQMGSGNPVSNLYTQSGNYTVTAIATSAFGCTDTASTSAVVVVHPSPIADFSMNTAAASILESAIVFSNESSTNTLSYHWDFGDNTTSTLPSPVHHYADAGVYPVTLVAMGAGGCSDTISHLVEIAPEFTFFVPNAFTPNADGNNDVFRAYGDDIVSCNMTIYNRWGKAIFSTDNMNLGWNGMDNNGITPAPDGMYVWKVIVKDFSGRVYERTGQVSLLR